MEEFSSDPQKKVVFVFAPKLTSTNAFLRFVMEEFEVKTDRSYGRSLKNFEEFLIDQYSKGISCMLLIDEAQNMTRDMLLLVQHLFNFSTNTEFLIQIALFAQPELQHRLNRLKSLQSRMSIAKLKPFDLDQTREMMQFRWTVAGGKELPFDGDAIAQIYRITEGVPRLIVKLANESLIKTAVEGRKTVTKDLVTSAASELKPD